MEDEIELVPVEGYTTLGRDPVSNAILNTDSTQYDAYIKARENAKKKDRTLEDLKNEVEEPVSYTHLTLPTSDLV